MRTATELVTTVATLAAVGGDRAEVVFRDVLTVPRALVPEAVDDIAAVLPAGMRELSVQPEVVSP